MFTESRKTHLLEEVSKITNEATLVKIESVVNNSKKKASAKKNEPSIYDFVGILKKKDANKMRKAIEDTCETINTDDWK